MKKHFFSSLDLIDRMQMQADGVIAPYRHQTVEVFPEKSDAGDFPL